MMFRSTWFAVVVPCGLVFACGGSSGEDAGFDAGREDVSDAIIDAEAGDATEADGAPDVEGDVADDGGADAESDGDLPDECSLGEALCLDRRTRRSCETVGSARRWLDETCADGSGCVRGACVSAECSDECTLGETAGGRACALFDLAAGGWVEPDPAAVLHDRSRAYARWIRRGWMAHGGVSGDARFSDPPVYENVAALGHTRDSAIWTGTYLAAEALRLSSTGAADARRHVEELVEMLHLWFNVSGQPGLLARIALPAGAHPKVAWDCDDPEIHCGIEYEGASYDYDGNVSRDQYQGVMLGYAFAYEALGEAGEPHRAMIREDVVALVRELMLERDVPVRVVLDGRAIPAFTLHLRFSVLAPREMEGGSVRIAIDTGDYEEAQMGGFQEFMPNLAHVVRQIPLMGWTPDIPRSSSAIMLASFFRVGLQVTEGVPGFEDDRAAFAEYYAAHEGEGGNVADWLAVARTWSYTSHCGEKYYGNNISMQPMENWARLEDDSGLRDAIVGEVLGARMWPGFAATKNPFFSFIYAGNTPGHPPAVVDAALAQLAQFPPPPRIRSTRDLRSDARYLPHEEGCTDQVHHGTAVDVADRCESDFLWQSSPWDLVCIGDPNTAFSGVDFLVAYWLGRYHGFVEDDSPGRCLGWR